MLQYQRWRLNQGSAHILLCSASRSCCNQRQWFVRCFVLGAARVCLLQSPDGAVRVVLLANLVNVFSLAVAVFWVGDPLQHTYAVIARQMRCEYGWCLVDLLLELLSA